MNKRIIASAGGDCAFIWDLYKDDLKFPIRDKAAPSVLGFMKNSKKLVIGYTDWSTKIYDVETLRKIRTVDLGGIPLASLKVNENTHYLGGFPNVLSVIDLRASQPIKY